MRIDPVVEALLLGLVLSAGAASCSAPLCDRSRSTYGAGVGDCDPSRYRFSVTPTADRTELSATGPLPVLVTQTNQASGKVYTLSSPTQVALGTDGAPVVVTPFVVERATGVLQIDRGGAALLPGPLLVEISLPELPGVTHVIRSDGRHRVYRQPHFQPPVELSSQISAHRSGTVIGRPAVQIASPLGLPGQLLITEQVSGIGMEFRWVDLYQQSTAGQFDYVTNAQWQQLQLMLSEGPTALLSLTQGALAIYDNSSVAGQRDLALLSLSGVRQIELSRIDPNIPHDATALGACPEEPVVALSRAGELRFFRINATPPNLPVKFLGTVPTSGATTMAVRDLRAAVPTQPATELFAASWDSQGGVQLISLMHDDQGVPSGVVPRMAPLDASLSATTGVTALALADLDSDGLQDLIVGQGSSIFALVQHPDGTFRQLDGFALALPAAAASISVGDVNGDNLPDLAVATANRRLFIYLNTP